MAKVKKVSIFDPIVSAYREVVVDTAKQYISMEGQLKYGIDRAIASGFKKVSVFDPFVKAFREVELEKAQKVFDEIPNVKARVAEAENE